MGKKNEHPRAPYVCESSLFHRAEHAGRGTQQHRDSSQHVCTLHVTPVFVDTPLVIVRDSHPQNTWCTSDICGLVDRCTEAEIHSVADAMAGESGMLAAGYEYVNLDDCWADKDRDADGRLQGQPNQFPSGMKALADYVHARGLKIGLYTCIGTETCKKNRPGSFGNFEIDAATFADWGIDLVKADFCHVPGPPQNNQTTQELYTSFSAALNATGHPMIFSLCEWGRDGVNDWGHEVAQM